MFWDEEDASEDSKDDVSAPSDDELCLNPSSSFPKKNGHAVSIVSSTRNYAKLEGAKVKDISKVLLWIHGVVVSCFSFWQISLLRKFSRLMFPLTELEVLNPTGFRCVQNQLAIQITVVRQDAALYDSRGSGVFDAFEYNFEQNNLLANR